MGSRKAVDTQNDSAFEFFRKLLSPAFPEAPSTMVRNASLGAGHGVAPVGERICNPAARVYTPYAYGAV